MSHAEIVQKSRSAVDRAELTEAAVRFFAEGLGDELPIDEVLSGEAFVASPYLRANVDRAVVEGRRPSIVHVYRLDADGEACDEPLGEGPEGASAAARRLALPSARLFGLWESLVYEDDLKQQALAVARTAALFSSRGVDPLLVCLNRSILLHGPPGTGKTALCRALAQKLSVRLADRYPRAQLIEVDAHGLFSKWFSESGKLVADLFARIGEAADDEDCLVCVLIDEVESLARARSAALSGSEPSDAIRAVNATLTELDRIRDRPNVLVLTTSNATAAIDPAFVDRADLKRYVGPPSAAAIYRIYRSCLLELMRTEIVAPAEAIPDRPPPEDAPESDGRISLSELSRRSVGLSGRALRKIPFLAHAARSESEPADLPSFLTSMAEALSKHASESQYLADELRALNL